MYYAIKLEERKDLIYEEEVTLLKEHGKCLADFDNVKKAKEFLVLNAAPGKIPPYAFTHVSHPCVLWTCENVGNYNWLVSLFRHLLDEYTCRYQKIHKCDALFGWLSKNLPIKINKSTVMTPHVQCMPDECKVVGDVVSAYRNYYDQHKRRFAKWEPRAKTPTWF